MTVPAPTVRAEIEIETLRVDTMIARARRIVAEDGTLDLSALENRVTALCASVGRASRRETEGVRETMVRFMDDLNELSEELEQRLESVAARIEAQSRRRASAAYQASAGALQGTFGAD